MDTLREDITPCLAMYEKISKKLSDLCETSRFVLVGPRFALMGPFIVAPCVDEVRREKK